MKNTTTTTKTTPKHLKYITELIVNGQVLNQKAKKVTCSIKGTEVTLNCCYISEHELKNSYKSSFDITVNEKHIEVVYCKTGNRVSATIYINKVLVFSSLSMQAVFTVLSTAYNISKNHLNNLYIKSNGMRKQHSKSINTITVNNTFEF